jgi:tetraacyldisaccharide 4'-kinase
MRAVGLQPLHGGAPNTPQRCFAFCGIGNPESFFSQLGQQSIEIAGRRTFPDHHNYTQKNIDLLIESARRDGGDCLVTTEKDAVKLRALSVTLPCYFLRIEIDIENSDRLKQLIIDAAKS